MLILALKQRSNQLMMSKDDSIRHSDQLAHQKTEFKVYHLLDRKYEMEHHR